MELFGIHLIQSEIPRSANWQAAIKPVGPEPQINTSVVSSMS
ncbi:hypothetical protein LEP1GSC050_0593 [Leptospira broomii serovar Hurstbridge str. 5399]|uniref:Uncharacterized protein n=1 Tax=Leptospira broomii serovar Hurstbridge str. 5399 TaxID=1049789 RepID=T0F766_9LEPT|nr:hypothetical protein LEP1GSC050_0593 [Leptospira broomii serovar Hurstbridge str. 5399]